jgi:hypothetical protein
MLWRPVMPVVEEIVSERVECRNPLRLSRNNMEFAGLVVYFSVIAFSFTLVFVLMLMPK